MGADVELWEYTLWESKSGPDPDFFKYHARAQVATILVNDKKSDNQWNDLMCVILIAITHQNKTS